MPDWRTIAVALREVGVFFDGEPQPVDGGDISLAWRLASAAGPLFVKTGPAEARAMFAAEADGLRELANAAAVRVPEAIAQGVTATDAYLVLEWLPLERPSGSIDRCLGRQLAQLHRTVAEMHGWYRDNTIGRTPQSNTQNANWASFFAQQRLGLQLALAEQNGFAGEIKTQGEALLNALPELLAGHQPPPSLLHGDLWGGNYAACSGAPCIFDPAVYFGDRETDLAMTRLFGGFSDEFYAAYEEAWPLPHGHECRTPLYQLYHVLNHLNLFGASYRGQALALMRAALG